MALDRIEALTTKDGQNSRDATRAPTEGALCARVGLGSMRPVHRGSPFRRCDPVHAQRHTKGWMHGVVYIDFKIECGFDRETGDLLVADVIDSDSGRLRFGDVDMSKQSYRDGLASLPEIKKKFDDVAALTDRFV